MHIKWLRVELYCIETGVAVEEFSGGMTHDMTDNIIFAWRHPLPSSMFPFTLSTSLHFAHLKQEEGRFKYFQVGNS